VSTPDIADTAARLAERGVARPFTDSFGETRHAPEQTITRLAERFLADEAALPAPICTPGRHHPELYGRVELEDGSVRYLAGVMPHEAAGYHILVGPGGTRRLVLAAPEQLRQPARGYGYAVQLYAARSADSWGIGDYRDPAQIARLAAASGASTLPALPDPRAQPDPPPAEQTVLAVLAAVALAAAHRARRGARRGARRPLRPRRRWPRPQRAAAHRPRRCVRAEGRGAAPHLAGGARRAAGRGGGVHR
jgi:hypothetical protein